MLARRNRVLPLALAFSLGGALPGLAQEPSQQGGQPSTEWRRFDEAAAPAPPLLTLPAGTWIKVRLDQMLSSDHNLRGDGFTATLSQPLVASGLVVARKGQTAGGSVAEAGKAGRARGTSRLGLELTELGLVDGRQVLIRTRLIEYQAGTSKGRDAATVVTGAGVGAAVGAVAEGGGLGAGIGAIIGGAAAAVGVLATRGSATVVYPEAELVFRLEEPLTISTENSQVAFRPVTSEDYQQRTLRRPSLMSPGAPPPHYYYWDDWYWGGYYRPRFFYGPGFYFYSTPRFFSGRFFRRR